MSGFYAAVDIGASQVKAMLATANMGRLVSGSVDTEVAGGVETIMARVIGLIEDLVARSGREASDLIGIGVSSFGFIDAARGVGIKSWRLDITDYPFAGRLAERFGVPVVIDNDAHASILGERTFGVARGHDNAIQLTVGTGLATGLLVNGQVVRGSRNVAGEVSHFTIETTAGLPCVCGRHGCAQAYISAQAMLTHMRDLLPGHPESVFWALSGGDPARISLEMLPRALDANDAVAHQVRDRLLKYLSSLVASLVIMFNPSLVIIGGGVSNLRDHLLVPLQQRVAERILHPVHECPIERAALGHESGMYGALAMIAARLDPNHREATPFHHSEKASA